MRLNLILMSLLFILQGSILLIVAMSSERPEVCLVDLKAIQSQLIRQLAERNASDSQIALASRQFKQKLKPTLMGFSKDHNAILLEKQSLLSGGKDVTEEVAQALSDAMRKKP